MLRVERMLKYAFLAVLLIANSSHAQTCKSLFERSKKLELSEILKSSKAERSSSVRNVSAPKRGKKVSVEERAKEFLRPGEKLLETSDRIPMVIEGLESKPVFVDETKPIIEDNTNYGAVVVGLGQAGLSAAYIMRGIKVLGLERGDEVGGLATGVKRAGMVTDDGTAYQSPPLLDIQRTLYRNLKIKWKRAKISGDSDTLYVQDGVRTLDGRVVHVFPHWWEAETVLHSLPAPFAMFKHRLEVEEAAGVIPDQPIHKFKNLSLDYIRFSQYVRGLPKWMRERVASNPEDTVARDLLVKLEKEIEAGIVDKDDPTALLYEHVSSYSNSAGGANPDRIHSITGANFEIAEMRERYTWPTGTGEVSEALLKALKARKTRAGKPLVNIQTHATVLSVKEHPDYVEVLYVQDGQRYLARAKTALMSTPLDSAIRIIKDVEKIAPDHYKVIQELREDGNFSDYAVVTMYVQLEGRKLNLENPEHPAFVKVAYDLWPIYKRQPHLSSKDSSRDGRPTDFISGHWQTTKGYTIKPSADLKYAVITAYVSQGPTRQRSQEELIEVTEKAISAMKEISAPFQREAGEPDIEVVFVATRFWKSSILVPAPGHSTYREPILDQPVGQYGRIFLAQSGKGTPSNEEAQSQGVAGGKRAVERLQIDRANEREAKQKKKSE